jgi:hypothetical protein
VVRRRVRAADDSFARLAIKAIKVSGWHVLEGASVRCGLMRQAWDVARRGGIHLPHVVDRLGLEEARVEALGALFVHVAEARQPALAINRLGQARALVEQVVRALLVVVAVRLGDVVAD